MEQLELDGADSLTPVGARATLTAALSPSRAADFMSCPLLYRFRAVDRLPERPSTAALRGTLVHAVLEKLFDLPSGERTPERAVELVRPAWERLLARQPELAELFAVEDGEPVPDADAGADPGTTDAGGATDTPSADEFETWLASAEPLVRRYFTLENPSLLEPAQREMLVQTRITVDDGELLLRGYIDRLDIAPNGAMRVVDYKTGKAPGPLFEAKALFQMRFYALVLWKLRGVVPRRLQLMYLGNGEVLRYDPDEAELRVTERKVAALWSAICQAARSGDWQPRPSKLCDYCDHKPRCPAHGGTPPPLPRVTIGAARSGSTRSDALPPPTEPLF